MTMGGHKCSGGAEPPTHRRRAQPIDSATHMELIDVVDEDDRVLRRATRAEMRRGNLLHRAVYILVRNGRGRLFVHRHSATKDVYPGLWDVTVGGVVAAGEDYTAAARRELAEELGIRTALRPLGPFRHADGRTRVIGQVFETTARGPTRLQTEEIVEGRFMSAAEVRRLVAEQRCCPDGVAALRAYGGELTAG